MITTSKSICCHPDESSVYQNGELFAVRVMRRIPKDWEMTHFKPTYRIALATMWVLVNVVALKANSYNG